MNRGRLATALFAFVVVALAAAPASAAVLPSISATGTASVPGGVGMTAAAGQVVGGMTAAAGQVVGGMTAAAGQVATVRWVVDGDTFDARIGGSNVRVRLVQVDAPEARSGAECWGRQASAALRRLLPPGTTVTLYTDPALDRTDRFGRALRYVFRGTTNVNVRLVAQGDAAPYFYDGARGRYAAGLERAALAARKARLGLWGACPAARYDPYRALDTGPAR